MANANNRDFLPEISELDLSLTQLKGLSVLDEHAEEALSVKALSERLGLSLAATSRSVDGLVKRKLIERDEDPDDRRVRRVRLTARAAGPSSAWSRSGSPHSSASSESFDDEQREKLADALDSILEHEDVRRFYRAGGRSK